jgi:hypothetical protein
MAPNNSVAPQQDRIAQRRLRMRYEKRRVALALLGAIPCLIVLLIAVRYSSRTSSTIGFGVCAFFVSALMLWRGVDAQRAVLPAIIVGLLPLTLSLCANQVHTCAMGGGCMSPYCMPACASGGFVAGAVMAWLGHRRRSGGWYWLSATLITTSMGAMGCSCIGYSGVMGLGLGFAVGLAPGVLSTLRRRIN